MIERVLVLCTARASPSLPRPYHLHRSFSQLTSSPIAQRDQKRHSPPQLGARNRRSCPLFQRRSSTQIQQRTYATPPAPHAIEATSLTADEYHELSDNYFESLLASLETLAEDRGDIDVEYSAGVLTVIVPNKGTYVLNKQPPNRQIWLSSPISGPKRYDWVLKDWIYLRDGSSLTVLLKDELDVDVEVDAQS